LLGELADLPRVQDGDSRLVRCRSLRDERRAPGCGFAGLRGERWLLERGFVRQGLQRRLFKRRRVLSERRGRSPADQANRDRQAHPEDEEAFHGCTPPHGRVSMGKALVSIV
jgi:hypothetical protein